MPPSQRPARRPRPAASQTPVTKRLWATRYKWTADKLAAAAPRDPAAQVVPKPPKPLSVTYSFAGDEVLREHVRTVGRPAAGALVGPARCRTQRAGQA